ncbi:MAG TPA: hypothetical protein VF538_07745 [Pyrinomonadaceae bacterium]|jgi:hypothetical protein
MFDGRSGAIIHLLVGGAFLVVAFSRRGRAAVARLNPYSGEWLIMLVAAAAGLIELYVGVGQLAGR